MWPGRPLRYAALCAVVALLVLAWALWPRYPDEPNASIADAASPTPTEIAQQLGRGGPGTWNDPRHARFEELFTSRYRSRGFAVRARFREKGPAHMLCAALLPRWDMSHVADEFHREAMRVFATDYPIDIYETYMTAQKVKVGELRTDPASQRVHILFNPPYAQDRVRDAPRRMRLAVPWSLDPSYLWKQPDRW